MVIKVELKGKTETIENILESMLKEYLDLLKCKHHIDFNYYIEERIRNHKS